MSWPSDAIIRDIMRAYERLRFEPYPYWMSRVKPDQRFRCGMINRLGFRGAEPEIPKRRARLLFVGDSVGFGVGASSDETTIPGYLAQTLSAAGLDAEVINASQRAHTLTQHLVRTLIDLEALEPDLLLYFFGYVDYYTLMKGRRPGFPINIMTGGRQARLLPRIWRRLWRRRSQRQDAAAVRARLSDDHFREGARILSERARVLDGLAAQAGRRAVFILQPVAGYGPRRLRPEEQAAVEREAEKTRRFSGRDSRRDFRIFYDAVRRHFSELARDGLWYCDLSTIFDDTEERVYLDHIHNHDPGYRAQAEAIARFLLDRSAVPPEPRHLPIGARA